MRKYFIFTLLLSLVLLFFGCNNPMSNIIDNSDTAGEFSPPSYITDSAYVYNDPARGLAIYVDESGTEIPVQAEEASGLVVCSEVIKFIEIERGDVTSRHAFFNEDSVKALVLGKRSDSFSGLWVIYTDGRVSPVINSEDLDTSELLEMVEGRQPLSGYFNWSYTALDMISNADASEIIITGYAENSGVERHNYIVEAGTTIGVYWAVTLDEDGYYHISRAKVIGYRDASSWKNYSWKNKGSDFRHQHRWMWTLRMFFTGWYDRYLIMPESVELGENAGEYNIYGTDQEYKDAVAVVTAKKVLSIEKYEDPGTGDPSDVLLFSSDRDGDFEIYALDLATDTLTQLTDNDSTDKHPALSSDGARVAFVSDRSGSWGLYTMNVDGTGVSGKLVDLTGSFYGYPAWSPDSTKIAFNIGFEIYIMNSDGTGQFNLTNTVFTNEIEPAWSPDGRLIAFSSSADGDFEIHTTKADGTGGLMKLTDNKAVDRRPAWSPDGTGIVYSTNIDSNYDIYMMGSDGSNPINLTASAENETSPSWSENGVAFVKNDDIFILQPGSSDLPQNLTEHVAKDLDPSW